MFADGAADPLGGRRFGDREWHELKSTRRDQAFRTPTPLSAAAVENPVHERRWIYTYTHNDNGRSSVCGFV